MMFVNIPHKKFWFGIAVLLIVIGGGVYWLSENQQIFFGPTESELEEGVTEENEKKPDIEVVARGLDIPWEIVFLPEGDLLVTERPGNLLKISDDGKEVIPIEGVKHIGEGGLLGLALDPDFEKNSYIYLYMTTQSSAGIRNRIERYVLEENSLSGREVILDSIPGAQYHDGGKIEFGPDGLLYLTTGDATVATNAQNQASLSGKILRIDIDGEKEVEVISYGHRNPQGLAWDDQGRLWATEHGRSGIRSGFDELNLIEEGRNYGWPLIQGDESREGMESPKAHSGPSETWAPAAAVYYEGSIFFTGLRGESLYEAKIDSDGNVERIVSHLRQQYGRLRALKIGPDGYFYISTSNRDGRGNPSADDDKIIRINPEIFN